MKNSYVDIPIIIDGKEIRTGNTEKCIVPHDHKKVLGEYHIAGKEEIKMAIESTLRAKSAWEELHWQHRVAIFLKSSRIGIRSLEGQTKCSYHAVSK